MKMLKKLLAIVLTGAMALSLFTACGSNAVTEKDIADAMNDMAKAANEDVTFTPRAKEREIARKIAELKEKESATATVADGGENSDDEAEREWKQLLGIDAGGANEENFVWVIDAVTDGLGASGQAVQVLGDLLVAERAEHSVENAKPENIRYMGTALYKTSEHGKPVTARVIVVTAKAKAEPEDADKD